LGDLSFVFFKVIFKIIQLFEIVFAFRRERIAGYLNICAWENRGNIPERIVSAVWDLILSPKGNVLIDRFPIFLAGGKKCYQQDRKANVICEFPDQALSVL
jgi:hypothetical protein